MDDRGVAWPDLRGLHPYVLRQLRVERDVLVRHRPLGGDFDLLGHLQDEVGRGDAPPFGEDGRRREVGRVAFGRAARDPVGDDLLLLDRQSGVVGKLAMLGRGVPGGHSTFVDDLGDHARPTAGLAVVRERKRRDLTRPVTRDATTLQDPGDILRVGDAPLIGRLSPSADLAAVGEGFRSRRGVAFEERVEGLDQFATGWGRAVDAEGILVVNPTRVANGPRLIEHEDLRSAVGPQAIRQGVADVLEDGKRDVVLAREPADRDRAVLLVRVDPEERDSTLFVGLRQLGQPRRIGLGQWALGPHEDNHHDPSGFGFVERVPGPSMILEPEIDRSRHRRRLAQHRSDHQQGQSRARHGRGLAIGGARGLVQGCPLTLSQLSEVGQGWRNAPVGRMIDRGAHHLRSLSHSRTYFDPRTDRFPLSRAT